MHPKTGRVCVPIDPRKADVFDPMAVPTLGSLAAEINAYDAAHPMQCRPCADGDKGAAGGDDAMQEDRVSDVEKTAMGGYMSYFQKAFLDPLYRGLKKQVRDELDQDAAMTVDF